MTPRSFALATVSTTESPTLMEGMGTVSEKCEDKYTTSVLLSFKASLFSNVQFLISFMQFSSSVTQSHTGLHEQNSSHELAKLSSLFSAFRKCLKLQNWYQNFFFFFFLMSVEHYY